MELIPFLLRADVQDKGAALVLTIGLADTDLAWQTGRCIGAGPAPELQEQVDDDPDDDQ